SRLLLLVLPPTLTRFPYPTLFRSTHGQQHQLGFQLEFGIRHLDHLAVLPFNARSDQFLDLAVFTLQTLGGNRPVTFATFFMRRRSEEHTSDLQSRDNLVCRLLL